MDDATRALRITPANAGAIAARGDYVLYWMIAARRTTCSFALDHALALAKQLGRPLLVLEALRAGYAWACDRHHTFVMQGMADNARRFAAAKITYLAYVEPEPGRGRGLLEALAKRACAVVTDEQPGFFLPRMVAAAAARIAVRVDQVDGNGIVPLRAVERVYTTAASFRRELHKRIHPHLLVQPTADPLAAAPRVARDAQLPGAILRAYPSATDIAQIPIDHAIAPVPYAGGSEAADAVADHFIAHKLARYAETHDPETASGLSPYLHFGHISAHDVAARVWRAARWDPSRVAGAKPRGDRCARSSGRCATCPQTRHDASSRSRATSHAGPKSPCGNEMARSVDAAHYSRHKMNDGSFS